ncbi:MAG: hypothetical protein PHC62_11525, partial [Candidatus Izemoplasmatales bacterium]|nr:hypothetical protein [Candidatus Izemoplasmatales bacterium]
MTNEFYEEYFQIIEDNFGRYFKANDPIESVNSLLKQPMTTRILYETSETITDDIYDLFKKNEDKIFTELDSLKGFKTHFCGSVAPQDTEKFLCRTGLYVDTTIISDPITFIHSLKHILNKPNFTELLFRHAFKMLKLKNALINDSETPILRIIPRPSLPIEDSNVYEGADKQVLSFFNELFDENIESFDELEEIISKIKTTDKLIENITNSKLLVPEITECFDIK